MSTEVNMPDLEIEPDLEAEEVVAFLPVCRAKLRGTIEDLTKHSTFVEVRRRFENGCRENLDENVTRRAALATQKCLEFSDYVVHEVLGEKDEGVKMAKIGHGCLRLCLRKFGADPRCEDVPGYSVGSAAGSSGASGSAASTTDGVFMPAAIVGSPGGPGSSSSSSGSSSPLSSPEEVEQWLNAEEAEDGRIQNSLPQTAKTHVFAKAGEEKVFDGTVEDD
eukprot:g15783.t1